MGLFDGSPLVGTAGFYREHHEKLRHKGRIWGVYMAPEYRDKGFGQQLLTALIEAVRALPDLDAIFLSVAVPQESARRVYASLGFERFGIELRSLRVDNRYIPEEHLVLQL